MLKTTFELTRKRRLRYQGRFAANTFDLCVELRLDLALRIMRVRDDALDFRLRFVAQRLEELFQSRDDLKTLLGRVESDKTIGLAEAEKNEPSKYPRPA